MLRLSKETDYGIVILSTLAGRSTPTTSAREVADEVNLSLPMVKKVLKSLATARLVDSHRGVHGGYALAKAPDDISVAEIIDALEGPVGITECTGTAPDDCNIADDCHVRSNWEQVNRAIRRALEGIKLSHMAGSLPAPLLSKVGGTPLWKAGTVPGR